MITEQLLQSKRQDELDVIPEKSYDGDDSAAQSLARLSVSKHSVATAQLNNIGADGFSIELAAAESGALLSPRDKKTTRSAAVLQTPKQSELL